MNKTDICNLALGHLGQYQIVDIDEEGPHVETLRLHYQPALVEVLTAGHWSFAITRKTLPQTVEPEFGWGHAYILPPKFIRVVSVNDIYPEVGTEPSYELEGRSILTNEDECNLRYVFLEEDPNRYPMDFVNALAMMLAARCCAQITGNVSMGVELENVCRRDKIPKARARDHSQNRRQNVPHAAESDWVASRYGR